MTFRNKIRNISLAAIIGGGFLGLHRLATDLLYDGPELEISVPIGEPDIRSPRMYEVRGEEEVGLFDTINYTLQGITGRDALAVILHVDKAFSKSGDLDIYCAMNDEVHCSPVSSINGVVNLYMGSLSPQKVQNLGEEYLKAAGIEEIREKLIKTGSPF